MNVIRSHISAYNKHDITALVELLDQNVKWYSVDGSKISVETDGSEAIKSWLKDYFADFPDVRSTVSELSQVGKTVFFKDHVSWTNKKKQRVAQESIAIYEVVNGKITRVWYFPSEKVSKLN